MLILQYLIRLIVVLKRSMVFDYEEIRITHCGNLSYSGNSISGRGYVIRFQ